MVEDLEKDYPASRFDYDWALLQDVLFQDKDYEGLLELRSPSATMRQSSGLRSSATSHPAIRAGASAAEVILGRGPHACRHPSRAPALR